MQLNGKCISNLHSFIFFICYQTDLTTNCRTVYNKIKVTITYSSSFSISGAEHLLVTELNIFRNVLTSDFGELVFKQN